MWLTQFSRSRSITSTTTTFGVRETLDSDDDDDDELEWDRSDFSRCLPESDALSSYDVNEMSEMFHRPFLDFDLSSALPNHRSSPCPITDRWIFETDSDRSLIQRSISRSLCDVSSVTQRREPRAIQSISLSDLRSIHPTSSDDMPPHSRRFTHGLYRQASLCHSISSMKLDSPVNTSHVRFIWHHTRLSRLAMIRFYIHKFSEKVSSVLVQVFQGTSATARALIDQETLDTYDIIADELARS